MAIFELLVSSDAIRPLVSARKSIADLRRAAMDEGMKTLLQNGALKIVNGSTDLSEVLSVCMK
jgi:type II secretory ATPase GspE/PulE/Tfp pilus assembly ATPase PilB-like protein